MAGGRIIKADNKIIVTAIMLFVLISTVQLITVKCANAMTSANYEISTNVVGSAGGSKTSSGHKMTDTIGQPTAIGRSSSSSFLGELGFIFTSMLDSRPPVVTVEAPAGGENMTGGTYYNVAWQASDNAGLRAAPITIRMSIDGGATWPYVWGSLPNTSPYRIQFPNATSTLCLISVEAIDIVGNTGSDACNSTFSLSSILDTAPPDQIVIKHPENAEYITSTLNYIITWEAHDVIATGDQLKANLYYTTDEVTWTLIAADVQMTNGGIGGIGEYSWFVPPEYSNTCRIRVEVQDPAGNVATKTSERFKIGEGRGSRIYVMVRNDNGDLNYCAVPFNKSGIASTSDLARSIGDQWGGKQDFNYITLDMFDNLTKTLIDDTWYYYGGDWIMGTDAAVNAGDAVAVTLGTDAAVEVIWTVSGEIPASGDIIYGLYKNTNGDLNRVIWTRPTTDTLSIVRSIGALWGTKIEFDYITVSIFKNDTKSPVDDTWYYYGGDWVMGSGVSVESGDVLNITIGTSAGSAVILGWN